MSEIGRFIHTGNHFINCESRVFVIHPTTGLAIIYLEFLLFTFSTATLVIIIEIVAINFFFSYGPLVIHITCQVWFQYSIVGINLVIVWYQLFPLSNYKFGTDKLINSIMKKYIRLLT